jgi:hypothetical protein
MKKWWTDAANWLAQAERRDCELRSGSVQSIPAEDVFAEARAILAGGMHGVLDQTARL